MKLSARSLEKQLRAVGHYRRINILSFLKKNKTATVGEIADVIHLHIQSTSQHLRILRLAGIVENIRRGKSVCYRISLKQCKITQSILREL